MTRVIRACAAVALSSLLAVLTGCTSAPLSEKSNTAGAAFQGLVQGGQQPVTGSTLQLYAVGTTGDGAAATALLTKTVTTSDGTNNASNSNANAGNVNNSLPVGAFTITGDYTCPTGTTEVYLVATGGNPGLGSGTNNKDISMMAALGQCGLLGSSTYVFVDEVTTVGSIAALYPYMSGYATVGSGSSDASAFATAFSTVNEFTNTATGLAPGPTLPAGYYASSTEINTLADITAACINSSGGTAGDGTPCGTLFNLTKPTGGVAATDVVGSLVQLLKNPTQNAAAIFNIGTASGPFQPTLTSAPSSWSLLIVPIPGTPTFSPAAGTYTSSQTVAISDSDPTATIYYTTNGTTPTTASTVYSGPFTVSSSETVEALAVESARVSSAVGSAAYTITSLTTNPVITTVSSIVAAQTQTITITGSGFGTLAAYSGESNYISLIDATKGFQAGYGMDTVGLAVSSWTNTQIVLTGFTGAYGQFTYYLSTGDAINLTVFNAQTTAGPGACNNIVVGAGATTCSGSGQAPAPTFSVAGGSYSATQLVSLNDTVSGAAIYYTTNGTTPSTASTLYTAPITVSSSETIEAFAVASGYTNSTVAAATYTITNYGVMSTFAGNGISGYTGDGGLATSAELVSPYAVAIDTAGNIYTADYSGNRIRKITPAGIISTFAGNGAAADSGDGGLATNAGINAPNGIALDSAGNVYIGEEHGSHVRKVTTAGIISTIAGDGVQGFSGDGGAATSAGLTYPEGICVDLSGNLYIADAYGHRVRKVTPAGIISTFAGTGTAGYNGDGIAATSALLNTPYDVTADTSGNIYISDSGNNRVRKVTAAGVISTVVGNGVGGYNGDGIAATSAEINGAIQISLDTSGNLFIADQSNHRIRKVNSSGIISTIAGNGTNGYTGDGGPALNAEMKNVEGVVTDPSGNVYIGDGGNSVLRKITYQASAPTVATPVFSPPSGTYTATQYVTIADATPGASIYYTIVGSTTATLYTGPITVPFSVTITAVATESGYSGSGTATANYVIAPQASAPTFSPAAGTYASTQSVTLSSTTSGASIYYTTNGTTPTNASTLYTSAISVSASETINAIAYASGQTASPVSTSAYVINTSLGIITTIAGNGTAGFSGDGGQATSAQLSNDQGVAVDAAGNVYIADNSNNRVRKVTPAGIITTIAGNGGAAYSGDGGQATSATLNYPAAVAVDPAGNLYIVDRNNNAIRKVTPAGVISTIAGTGTAGYNGDGMAATSALLNSPRAIALDAAGNVYISDSGNSRIRKVTTAGIISTYAGNGVSGYNGDGITATTAELYGPDGIAFDSTGVLYIADLDNFRIRKVLTSGLIYTIAGNGVSADAGDGGAANLSELTYPEAIAIDSAGNGYVTEYSSNRVRKITASNGIISTVAGGGSSTLDGIAATSALLSSPFGVAVDGVGSIYIADTGTNRLRKVSYGAATAVTTPTFSPGTGTYSAPQTVTISSTTTGAAIYYTTDGSTPTQASALYTAPITVSGSETVSAIAYANGYAASAVGTAVYSLNTPLITNVSAVIAQQTQTFTVTGSGFGTLTAYSGTNPYIVIHDVTNNNWSAGSSTVGDTVGLSVTSWTNTQIVITGFTGAYGGGNTLNAGDNLLLQITNPQTGYGPGACSNIVVAGGATTCTH